MQEYTTLMIQKFLEDNLHLSPIEFIVSDSYGFFEKKVLCTKINDINTVFKEMFNCICICGEVIVKYRYGC
jgi:hypothetical protein